MKRISYTLIACLLGSGLWAQNADALLAAFSKKLQAHESVEIAFSFANDRVAKQNFTGTVLCRGNKFRLLTNDFEVYCDGRSKWFCNRETNEIIVQHVSDEAAADFTDHPLRFISNFQNGFSARKKGTRRDGNRVLVDIELTPVDKKAPYTAILLTLEEETLAPYTLRYTAKDGHQYGIRITKLTSGVETFDGYFAFPKHKYPHAEIVDLR